MCLFCTKSKPKAKAVLLNKPVVDQNGASYVKPASVPAVIKVRSAVSVVVAHNLLHVCL